MISSTWSQIAQPDKHNQLPNSPMSAFSRNTQAQASSSINPSFYKHTSAYTSPSLIPKETESSSPQNETANEAQTINDTQMSKSLISNTDQTVSLIQSNFSESESNILASKIQILPPINHNDSLTNLKLNNQTTIDQY